MLFEFLSDYMSIVIFLFVALGLSMGFIVLNFLFSPSNPYPEKLSAYECGFKALSDSRMEYDVRFFLVAILFNLVYQLIKEYYEPYTIFLSKLSLHHSYHLTHTRQSWGYQNLNYTRLVSVRKTYRLPNA